MGSKMNRMVLLYTLILCMVSLPTILPKQLLVEVADNQDGDDYDAPMNPPLMDYSMGQQNKVQYSVDKKEAVAKRGQDYGPASCPYCNCPFCKPCRHCGG